MKPVYVLFLTIFLAACTHSIHQVNVSEFRPYRTIESGEIVKAQAEQFTILGFATQTNYIDEAYRKLMDKCPNGVITGITTQISTSHGFFSWTNKVLMQGLCVLRVARKHHGSSQRESARR